MSKITITKQNRIYELVHYKNDKGEIVKSRVEKRLKKIEPQLNITCGDCYHCHRPVLVSPGQLINFVVFDGQKIPTHKACRKLAK